MKASFALIIFKESHFSINEYTKIARLKLVDRNTLHYLKVKCFDITSVTTYKLQRGIARKVVCSGIKYKLFGMVRISLLVATDPLMLLDSNPESKACKSSVIGLNHINILLTLSFKSGEKNHQNILYISSICQGTPLF